MCHLYIGYRWFLNDYPVFVYSTLPWTTIRSECTRCRRWLDSDETKSLPTSDLRFHSGKGTLSPYRESQNETETSEFPFSFHSLEDDEVEAQVGGEMVIFTSLANLNI
ncbi:hypothetical protein BDV3_007150 [Batrachochytrium dendrobatidis]